MEKIHQKLRQKYSWYDSWHNHSRHGAAHWLLFLLIAVLFTLILVAAAEADPSASDASEDCRREAPTLTLTDPQEGIRGAIKDYAVTVRSNDTGKNGQECRTPANFTFNIKLEKGLVLEPADFKLEDTQLLPGETKTTTIRVKSELDTITNQSYSIKVKADHSKKTIPPVTQQTFYKVIVASEEITGPTIEFINPNADEEVERNDFRIRVRAQDATGVSGIAIVVDNAQPGSPLHKACVANPAQVEFRCETERISFPQAGQHTIRVTAEDSTARRNTSTATRNFFYKVPGARSVSIQGATLDGEYRDEELTIPAGQRGKLKWEANPSFTTCTLSESPANGNVINMGTVAKSGERSNVGPINVETTYTLTCTGPLGSNTDSVKFNIRGSAGGEQTTGLPTISVIRPFPGSTVTGKVTIRVTAGDAETMVNQVKIALTTGDGTPAEPRETTCTNTANTNAVTCEAVLEESAANTTYNVRVTATDKDVTPQTATREFSFTKAAPTPPAANPPRDRGGRCNWYTFWNC